MLRDTLAAPVARFQAWRGPLTPFAVVTAAAAAVIWASGIVDALSQTADAGPLIGPWTWLWTVLAFAVAASPLLLGGRCRRWVGLVGTAVFVAVTVLQLATADRPIISANNLVLYPMVSCYMGWFYPRWVARTTVAVAAAASGTALLVNPFLVLATTWLNLTLASAFCLECAAYLHIRLERLARTDPLTGALNRSGLADRIGQELARASRTRTPLTVAVLDLDDFKAVNDTHGHAAGDQLLVDVVAGLRRVIRPYDSIARLGGDEFMILLPGLNPEVAEAVLDRLRRQSGDVFSSGVATSTATDTVRTLTERADQLLYRDKRSRKSQPTGSG